MAGSEHQILTRLNEKKQHKINELNDRIKELEARISMLNKCIDNNESNHDYAIATDSVRAFLTAPMEDLKDLKF